MFLSLFAHAVLRIFLGGILIYLGYRHLVRDHSGLVVLFRKTWPRFASFFARYLALVEIAIGGMFFVGAYTQAAAIVAIVLSVKMLVLKRHLIHPSIPQPLFYVLVMGVSLSLFITGAGVLAFDLPL